ncbi:MAG: type II toxin-antitoxin system RelE/ParE family toxin [Chloroflexi bacterium]|nr:type II toxin-antitoxin system RelE/ParE family toxin [Chloroflexota bacterium]MCL5076030.1 type II toxin-antitoxin system RelE/ParE family toxin [Chloroflexota bacterium]
MYELVFSREAVKSLERATPQMRRRIIRALERTRADPLKGRRLRGELEGLFSLRIGGLRAVYEVDAEARAMIVHAIGPWGDIYKK